MSSFTSMPRALISLLALFAFAQLAMGAALSETKRDVFVPPVLYPHAGTVWTKGQRHNVTWDVSHPPKQITNGKGIILLRKGDTATPVVLASGFNILLGRIEVSVPWVIPDDDYSIVLFGDSGNFSPKFTINGPPVF